MGEWGSLGHMIADRDSLRSKRDAKGLSSRELRRLKQLQYGIEERENRGPGNYAASQKRKGYTR